MIETPSVGSIYKELRKRFPIIASDKPLALSIRDQLIAEYPVEIVNKILCRHTKTSKYMKGIKFGDDRYNLDGTIAGPITPEQKELARLRLNYNTRYRGVTRATGNANEKARLQAIEKLKRARAKCEEKVTVILQSRSVK